MEGTASAAVPPPAETNVVIRSADGRAFRRSVQVFFVNERGEFLLCCPVGHSNHNYRQTVQGGSVAGELPTQTAVRETWEEIGFDLEQHAMLITEVLPRNVAPPPYARGGNDNAQPSNLGSDSKVNERGEIVSEERAAFRYLSKNWKKMGISGQEMYPLLYFVHHSAIKNMNVRSKDRGVRQEFRAVYWGSLSELAQKAPPVKQQLMANVCPAVAHYASQFLAYNQYPYEAVALYLQAVNDEAQKATEIAQ